MMMMMTGPPQGDDDDEDDDNADNSSLVEELTRLRRGRLTTIVLWEPLPDRVYHHSADPLIQGY